MSRSSRSPHPKSAPAPDPSGAGRSPRRPGAGGGEGPSRRAARSGADEAARFGARRTPEQIAFDAENRRRIIHMLRTGGRAFRLWRACGHGPCERARDCEHPDAPCFNKFLRALSPEQKARIAAVAREVLAAKGGTADG